MFEQQTTLLSELSAASLRSGDDYLRSAREILRQLVSEPDLLGGVALKRGPGAYARNLLFGDDRMSIWALVWAPHAATPIHDHHCSCCFGVLTGTIREIRFGAIDDGRVTQTTVHDRSPGFVTAMMPNGPNIHQMVNASDEEAISIHIYGYDHRSHASSIHREYEVATCTQETLASFNPA